MKLKFVYKELLFSKKIEILSSVFIFVFIYTSLSKLLELDFFKAQLEHYPFLGHFAGFISVFIPFCEITICILLVAENLRMIGFYASLILLSGFTTYLILMIFYFGKQLPCSCGGVIRYLSWKQHIFFNLILIAGSVYGILWERKQKVLKDELFIKANELA